MQIVQLNKSMLGNKKSEVQWSLFTGCAQTLSSWTTELKSTHRSPFDWKSSQAEICYLDLSLTSFKDSQKLQGGAIWLTHFHPTHPFPSAPAHCTLERDIPQTSQLEKKRDWAVNSPFDYLL